MSLTDDWKAGKLEDGDYYCKITESPETEIIYSGGGGGADTGIEQARGGEQQRI